MLDLHFFICCNAKKAELRLKKRNYWQVSFEKSQITYKRL